MGIRNDIDIVITGLDPVIHVFAGCQFVTEKTWIRGSSPRMTVRTVIRERVEGGDDTAR